MLAVPNVLLLALLLTSSMVSQAHAETTAVVVATVLAVAVNIYAVVVLLHLGYWQ